MKKIILTLLILFSCFFGAASIVACNGAEYVVTFIADGNVIATDTYTTKDKKITEPTVPKKNGYIGIWGAYNLIQGDITVEAIYQEIKAQSIELDQENISLDISEVKQLTATVLPADTLDKNLQWISVNEAVAKVIDGMIYPIDVGNTTIYAISSNNLKASCEVVVTQEIPLQKLYLNSGIDISLLKGEQTIVSYSYEPMNTTEEILFTSSNLDVFRVEMSDEEIYIIAEGIGTAILTATSTNGVTKSIEVNVYSNNAFRLPQTPTVISILDKELFSIYKIKLQSVEGKLYTKKQYGKQCLFLDFKVVGGVEKRYYTKAPTYFMIRVLIYNGQELVKDAALRVDISQSWNFSVKATAEIGTDFDSGFYELQLTGYNYSYQIGSWE